MTSLATIEELWGFPSSVRGPHRCRVAAVQQPDSEDGSGCLVLCRDTGPLLIWSAGMVARSRITDRMKRAIADH